MLATTNIACASLARLRFGADPGENRFTPFVIML
jgi:hypothetical protein